MTEPVSPLAKARVQESPQKPSCLSDLSTLQIHKGKPTDAIADSDAIKQHFPLTFGRPCVTFQPGESSPLQQGLRVGIVLSGGQAPGGHNVIAGLFDALQGSQLIGFLDGPQGVIDGTFKELTGSLVDQYRNLGGFDIIGSGRTKIESQEQLEAALRTCQQEKLDGLVIIGGDDSNTNAAVLAEFFQTSGCETRVVGVPKTIDGDLKSEEIEISFGHDTACKVYSELIGNLMRDAMSARKYYHFVKLMGRSASHIALECALVTHPNVTLIGEEVAAKDWTLEQVTTSICDVIMARAKAGKSYGVVLIPEGLIEFIPEVGHLISELNSLLASGDEIETVVSRLSKRSRSAFSALPESIQHQLLLDRDPHGNVQVSRIETERLLIATVEAELKQRQFGGKFGAVHHFFGYEGRSAMPSRFDCNYCYALGHTAALLVRSNLSGYMATVHGLAKPIDQWVVGGTPLTMLMNIEERKGKPKPVIRKALVDLSSPSFHQLEQNRTQWALEDHYGYPGPIQFFGPGEIVDQLPVTLARKS